MNAARSVTATFTRITYGLSVSTTGGGTVTSTPAGISCGATCAATYDAGTAVTLTANPDATATFAGWSGVCTGTASCTVTMDAAKTVGARFIFPLTVSKSGTGSGTVTSTPAGIACGTTCTATYDAGATVTLTPAADVTSTFAGWAGACTGTGVCTVTMDSARSVAATFTRKTYALTVSRTGGGTITSNPAGIACGATCTATYDAGTAVTLTATPDATATFAGWTGACSGTVTTCTVTIDAAKSVGARFIFPLSVSTSGTGSGTVTSSPAGIACGATCSATYDGGTAVTLTPVADATSTFAGWSGDCTGASCTLTMNAARSVTATFTRKTYALSVTRTGGGTIASTPAGIDCGATCTATYVAGTAVVLTATPDATATFAGWTGACSGTVTTCTVTMDGAKSVNARFIFPLSVSTSGTGSGIVTSTPAGITCGTTCSATYDAGVAVTLTAVPDATSTFTGWGGGACTGTGSCTVTMNAARSVTATFTRNTYALSVNRTGSGTIASNPAGIDCGATCTASYDAGTVVALTATPDATATFAGWTGACTGTGSCTLSMNAAKSVGATFTP
jgi:hypothetical protein